MKKWREWEIKEIKEGDEGWLKRLKAVKPAVRRLYYRGDWKSDVFENCLAVVGARKMTAYGEQAVERLLPMVVQAGVTIVSGFMYGVDSKAHQVCLDYGGRTVAVLGCGLDEPTPASNDKLYSEILAGGGLVVSEYDSGEKAQRWMFPQRNRIVAGLSQATLVIEGGEKSGTLITARITKEQGKPVLAVPGPVGSSMGRAGNKLIKEGAVLVESGEEILKIFATPGSRQAPPRGVKLSGLEKRVVEELKREELDMDELCRKLKIGVAELGEKLSELQLKGVIKEFGGKYVLLGTEPCKD